jgi:hypothetical protein
VIWTLPGLCCTFDPAPPVVAAAVGAAAIATAAAPAADQRDDAVHLDAHCHSFFHVCLLLSMTYSRIVLERINVVLAGTRP